jgi:hypothetical protein
MGYRIQSDRPKLNKSVIAHNPGAENMDYKYPERSIEEILRGGYKGDENGCGKGRN